MYHLKVQWSAFFSFLYHLRNYLESKKAGHNIVSLKQCFFMRSCGQSLQVHIQLYGEMDELKKQCGHSEHKEYDNKSLQFYMRYPLFALLSFNVIVLVLVITYIKYKYCEIKKIVTSIRHRKCFTTTRSPVTVGGVQLKCNYQIVTIVISNCLSARKFLHYIYIIQHL